MRRLLAGAAGLAILVAVSGAGAAASATTAAWTGRYTLGGVDELSITLSGKRALVALGAAHAELQSVPALDLGRPRSLPAAGPPRACFLRRRDREGAPRRHRPSGLAARNVHDACRQRRPACSRVVSTRAGGGVQAVVDDPYGPARLVDLDSGRVRALYPAGGSFSIGSGFATRAPTHRNGVVRRRQCCPDRRQRGDAAAGAPARGAIPQRLRHARGDAVPSTRRRQARRRRLRSRLGLYESRLPARALGALPPARRRRPRLRQARYRPVRRYLPGRIADRRHDRHPRPRRRGCSAVPGGAAGDRPRPRRADGSQPGRLDRAARGLPRAGGPVPRALLGPGRDGGRERHLPGSRRRGRASSPSSPTRRSTRRC